LWNWGWLGASGVYRIAGPVITCLFKQSPEHLQGFRPETLWGLEALQHGSCTILEQDIFYNGSAHKKPRALKDTQARMAREIEGVSSILINQLEAKARGAEIQESRCITDAESKELLT
jgi:hypothetical protein